MRKAKGRARLVLLASLLTVLLLGAPAHAAPPSQSSEPGPATERVLFKSFHVDRAALEVEAGAMDLYIFSLKTAAAREIQGSPGVRLYEAPASTLSLILNPAPAPEGQLNPFSLREVRQAIQHIVNRDFIAREIYGGRALPMVTHVSPTDFDFLTVYDLVKAADIRYDPELAREMVTRAMEKAGAQLQDEVWHYNGRPVGRLKFIIRVEDERREIGDLVRAELRKLGFQVNPSYQQFAPAILTVYSSDPQLLQWHIYTEGWGRAAPDKYDFSTINQMTAPWLGNMPGWKEAGLWQYERPDLDELGQRIFTGDFKDQKERNALYRRLTDLALEDSVRVWVVTPLNSFPASDELTGVTEDVVAGPKGPWTLREAQVPGKDELTIGNLWVWTERTTWNPVGGFGDVYSTDIWRNLNDPPIWNHPFTGVPIPFRANFTVETAGPSGKLAVPADAVMWDAQADEWRPVGPGTQATSKVTMDYSRYFQSKWHHGQPITMADAIYSIYQAYEMAYDTDKVRIEFAIAATARPFLNTFRGFRIVDDNTLEVYVDFWHFEENLIASYASPTGLDMPWEILAAMDTLVFDERRAAYSDTAAARFNVPWLSLVMDRDARLVRRTLTSLLNKGSIPEHVFTLGGKTLTDVQKGKERYQAAISWFDEHKLLVISNGPYMLTRYDPPAQRAELQAFRDRSYPFSAGDWFFGQPQRVEFAQVEAPSIQIGQPSSVDVSLKGPGALALRYILFDPAAGKVLEVGDAQQVSPQQFTVTLDATTTSQLQTGLYQVFLAASSDQLSQMVERRVDVEATLAGPAETGAAPEPEPGAAPPPEPEEEGGGGGAAGIIGGAIGGVAVIAIALFFLFRKRLLGRAE